MENIKKFQAKAITMIGLLACGVIEGLDEILYSLIVDRILTANDAKKSIGYLREAAVHGHVEAAFDAAVEKAIQIDLVHCLYKISLICPSIYEVLDENYHGLKISDIFESDMFYDIELEKGGEISVYKDGEKKGQYSLEVYFKEGKSYLLDPDL